MWKKQQKTGKRGFFYLNRFFRNLYILKLCSILDILGLLLLDASFLRLAGKQSGVDVG